MLPILLNTPIQTGACVPPHRLRIPPPSVCSSRHRTRTVAYTFFSTRHHRHSRPLTAFSLWSPPRLDVSAPTFPSYFSSGFLSILNFPSQVFFLTFSSIWVWSQSFARRLSAPLFSSLSRPFNFSVGSSSAAFLWLVPSSAASQPDDFLPYSVLQPMPLGIVR